MIRRWDMVIGDDCGEHGDDLCAMYPATNEGAYVLYSDHEARVKVLRDALETVHASAIDRLGPGKFGCSKCRSIGPSADGIEHHNGCVIAKVRVALKETE